MGKCMHVQTLYKQSNKNKLIRSMPRYSEHWTLEQKHTSKVCGNQQATDATPDKG